LTRARGVPAAAGLLLAVLLTPGVAQTRSLALSFDDGPDMSDRVGLGPRERNDALLKQLADARIKSILFVTRTDANPGRNELIRAWGIQGHLVGNHTATHPNLDEIGLADYERDTLACETALRDMPGFVRRFRFPYLKEGDTVEKRDGFRAFLDAHGYATGAVSIDASDWYYNLRLRARLEAQPDADTRPYRDAYLRHLDDRARYYDGLSRQVLGRSVRHVLLLHHNLINALFLADVIHMFRDKGWTFIDPDAAFEDPVYALRPATLPAGESILWALAKREGMPGLRYPAEDGVYEQPILDRLGL
jgi:peptidoglycan/xylan/chitin deacetylase (PgdA/CDA1 family)